VTLSLIEVKKGKDMKKKIYKIKEPNKAVKEMEK